MKHRIFLLPILFLLCSCAAPSNRLMICHKFKCRAATIKQYRAHWVMVGFIAGMHLQQIKAEETENKIQKNAARSYQIGCANAIRDCGCDLDPNEVCAIDPNLIRVL